MPYSPDEIERMTPAIRAEIQDWLVAQHFARKHRAKWGNDKPKRGNGWLMPWRENSQDWSYRRLGGLRG
jgi:hypothetical protein